MGTSCLDISGIYDDCCPLFLDRSCIPGLDTDYMGCPYKDGWRICWYYLTQDRCDKSKCGAGDMASLSYAIYKYMVKKDE